MLMRAAGCQDGWSRGRKRGSMEFSIAPAIFERFPGLRVAVVVARGIDSTRAGAAVSEGWHAAWAAASQDAARYGNAQSHPQSRPGARRSARRDLREKLPQFDRGAAAPRAEGRRTVQHQSAGGLLQQRLIAPHRAGGRLRPRGGARAARTAPDTRRRHLHRARQRRTTRRAARRSRLHRWQHCADPALRLAAVARRAAQRDDGTGLLRSEIPATFPAPQASPPPSSPTWKLACAPASAPARLRTCSTRILRGSRGDGTELQVGGESECACLATGHRACKSKTCNLPTATCNSALRNIMRPLFGRELLINQAVARRPLVGRQLAIGQAKFVAEARDQLRDNGVTRQRGLAAEGLTRLAALGMPLSLALLADSQHADHFVRTHLIGDVVWCSTARARRACAAPPILPSAEVISLRGAYQASTPRSRKPATARYRALHKTA